jgi:hypothetical protein
MHRKKTEPTQLQESVKAPPSQAEANQSKPVKKHVRKIEEYDEYVPPAQSQAGQVIDVTAREVVEDEEEIDPIEEFLAQIEQEQGYVLRVDRLTQYRRTGLMGRGAPREFQGEIPFSPQTYLTDIQAWYGPGDYLLTLKNSQHQFIKKWVEHIGAPALVNTPATTAVAAPVTSAVAYQQPAPVQPQSDIDQLISLTEKLSKIRKAMGWDHEPPPREEKQTEAVTTEKPMTERLVETLATRLIEKGDENSLDRALSVLMGKEDKDTSWTSGMMDLLKELAQPFIPIIASAIARQMQQQPHPPAPLGQLPAASVPLPATPIGNQSPQQLAQPGASTAPGNSQVNVAAQQVEHDFQRLMTCIVMDCLDNVSVEASADRVSMFDEKYPEYHGIIESLITAAPGEVLTQIAQFAPGVNFAQVPHAMEWMIELQTTLREPTSDEGQSIQEQGAPQSGV